MFTHLNQCDMLGPLCGVCEDSYAFRTSTQRCEPCSNSLALDGAVILALCFIGLIGLIVTFVYSRPYVRERLKTFDDVYVLIFSSLGVLKSLQDSTPESKRFAARKIARRVQIRLKIYITLWQIISIVPFTLDMQFPSAYSTITTVLGVFNLSISRSTLVSCSSGNSYDAIDELMVETIYPIVLVAMIWSANSIHVAVASARASPSVDNISSIRANYFKAFLVFSYLVLPGTSVTIFRIFSCQDIDPDNVSPGDDLYMTVDYSVSCTSARYNMGLVWAIVCIFIYPVGIPLYYCYELYIHRESIRDRTTHSVSQAEFNPLTWRLQSLQLLFDPYKPHLWYWELVETINRLMLTGVLVLISQGSAIQIVFGVAISLVFLRIYDVNKPYSDNNLQVLRESSQWQIFLVFFVAMLLKADFGSLDNTALGVFLVLVISATVVYDLLRVLWMFCMRTSDKCANHVLEDSYADNSCGDVELAMDAPPLSTGKSVSGSDCAASIPKDEGVKSERDATESLGSPLSTSNAGLNSDCRYTSSHCIATSEVTPSPLHE